MLPHCKLIMHSRCVNLEEDLIVLGENTKYLVESLTVAKESFRIQFSLALIYVTLLLSPSLAILFNFVYHKTDKGL